MFISYNIIGLLHNWQIDFYHDITISVLHAEFNPLKPEQNVWHFANDIQMHLHQRKDLYFDSNFTENCSCGSNLQIHINLGNGLAWNMHKPLTQPIMDKMSDAIWHPKVTMS